MTIFLTLFLYMATLIAYVVAIYFWVSPAPPREKIRRAPAPRHDGVTAAQRGGAREVFTEPQAGRRILAAGATLLAVVFGIIALRVGEIRWLALAWVAGFLLAAGFLLWTGRTNRLTIAPEGIRLRRHDGETWLPAESITRIDLLQALHPARDGGSGTPTRHYLLIAVAEPATIGRLSRRQRRLRRHLGQYGRATRPAVVVVPDEYPGRVDQVGAALRRRLPRVPVRYAETADA
ncbi:hypothetical protein GCM10009557_26680 [Virgisporangium ochraceum]